MASPPPIVAVLTADQRGSRRKPDQVPALLDSLTGVPTLLGFERTAGDEIQGVITDPVALTSAVGRLLRAKTWIGVGLGPIEAPLPPHARAGRGPAYVAARSAVEQAKGAARPVRVVGAEDYPAHHARLVEDAVWLWDAIMDRRTTKGWAVVDLLAAGLSHQDAAHRLGITPSAVSQRARAAAWIEGQRAEHLVAALTARAGLGADHGADHG